MKIVEWMEGGVFVIHLSGRLDSTSIIQFSNCLKHTLEMNAMKILVNFEEVEYLSSVGIRALISALNKIQERGGTMAICSLQDNIEEIDTILRLRDIFTVYPTEAEAIQALQDQ